MGSCDQIDNGEALASNCEDVLLDCMEEIMATNGLADPHHDASSGLEEELLGLE